MKTFLIIILLGLGTFCLGFYLARRIDINFLIREKVAETSLSDNPIKIIEDETRLASALTDLFSQSISEKISNPTVVYYPESLGDRRATSDLLLNSRGAIALVTIERLFDCRILFTDSQYILVVERSEKIRE